MDERHFDRLARAITTNLSRRSVMRGAAGSAVAGPLSLLGVHSVQADGKDKAKPPKVKPPKDRGNGRGADVSGGNAIAVADSPQAVTPALPAQTSQTIQTNNQVCAGDCAQTNQQAAGGPIAQTALTGNAGFSGLLPAYRIDVACQYDAPGARTNCTCTGRGDDAGPLVLKITLPVIDLCGIVVIGEEMRPETRRTIPAPTVPPVPVPASGGGQASAGNGGTANSSADGGAVTIGDVQGSNNVSIDASGGVSNADASGGNGNVAVAGGGNQPRSQPQVQAPDQVVIEPALLTLALDGNVGLGRPVTYWVDTDAGRRPARGPALVQVQEQTAGTGTIVVEARNCAAPDAQPNYDWFGQCTAMANGTGFHLFPAGGAATPLATAPTNAQGRARFANLPPGAYQVKSAGAPWCYAESDTADASGNIQVAGDQESHVWSFNCGAPASS